MSDRFYPCILDCQSGRIIRRVSDQVMTREQAIDYLKLHYRREWLNCDALPQPVTLAVFVAGPSKQAKEAA